MASNHAPRDRESIVRPISIAATTLASDNNSLISDFRRAFTMIKELAVSMEKENKTGMVKELENDLIQLVDAYEECTRFCTVMQSLGNNYEPEPQPTDFKKLLKNETTKLKAASSSNKQRQQYLRQFKEAVWNVHHAGQPMPGEEQEDVVMSSTQNVILNIKCPVSGKLVTDLAEPVRSMDCKHVYEKVPIMHLITSNRGPYRCPVSACRGILTADRVVCDALLPVDIEEQRSLIKESMPRVVEDFTGLDDD